MSADGRRQIKVIFFVTGRHDPASRFRVFDFLPYLEAAGVVCHINVCAPGFYAAPKYLRTSIGYHALNARKILSRIGGIIRARSCDVAVVQRELIPYNLSIFEKMLSCGRRGPALVYDFDDAVYLNWGAAESAQNKIVQIITAADFVMAGNRNLAKYAAKWNRQVALLPTCVDNRGAWPKSSTETAAEHSTAYPFVIGWTGTTSTIQYLDLVAPALQRLQAKNRNLVIKVMCNWPGGAPPVLPFLAEHVQWSPELEQSTVARFDCGIMPLTDDEWARSKCSLKVLMYFAAGVPAVVSPVGSNADIVKHGHNGYWATSDTEWELRIQALIDSRSLRTKFAAEGKVTLEESYSTEVCSRQMVEMLRQAIETKQRKNER